MAASDPGFSTTSPSSNELLMQKLQIEQVIKGGASWFITVSVLSAINGLLTAFGAPIRFIFGLGVTEIVNAVTHELGKGALVPDLIINGFVIGLFVIFWRFARQGKKWAFLVGMVLYLIDGLIMIPFDLLGAAFHAYALWRMFTGFRAIAQLERLAPSILAAGGTMPQA